MPCSRVWMFFSYVQTNLSTRGSGSPGLGREPHRCDNARYLSFLFSLVVSHIKLGSLKPYSPTSRSLVGRKGSPWERRHWCVLQSRTHSRSTLICIVLPGWGSSGNPIWMFRLDMSGASESLWLLSVTNIFHKIWKKRKEIPRDLLGRVESEAIGGNRLLLNFRDEPNLKKCRLSSGSVTQFWRERDNKRHKAHWAELLFSFAAVSSKLHCADQSDKLLQRPHKSDVLQIWGTCFRSARSRWAAPSSGMYSHLSSS